LSSKNSNLEKNCLDEGVDGRSKGSQLLLAQADAVEAPQEDASFTKYGEEVQHFVLTYFSKLKKNSLNRNFLLALSKDVHFLLRVSATDLNSIDSASSLELL
jgi:hypothetical protein